MTLYIDSTDNKKTIIHIGDKEFINEVTSPRDQNVLGFIQKSFSGLGLTPQDITSIEVNPGPGSFTGTRIGVTVANALAYSLGVLVNNQKPPIEVVYSQDPSITTPKLKS